jgi:uncharacterized protein (TIGR04222 family)
MNPFDWRGPEFLFFYLIYSTVVIVILAWLLKQAETFRAPKLDLGDPYLIAHLRGGKNEVLRVAVISLIDRGLLIASGENLSLGKNASPDMVRTPLDQSILQTFTYSAAASTVFQDAKLGLHADRYGETLKALRLLPDAELTAARWLRFLVGVLLLVGVGGVKVLIALSRGRTNISFLMILMAIAIVVARYVSFPRLTAIGEDVLKDIQNLYGGLRNRAAVISMGGATIEAVMLAAVFGISALSSTTFAFTKDLFPRAQQSSGASSSSCGSSCGSSGGSSCGSSCGGGGCGGGCGGCGS